MDDVSRDELRRTTMTPMQEIKAERQRQIDINAAIREGDILKGDGK